jgi:hypothetical protein
LLYSIFEELTLLAKQVKNLLHLVLEARQEDREFQASLGNIARLKKQKGNK